MPEIMHRFVEVGGVRLHVAEAGSGPLVILLHGFPESWYSWRHQLKALAASGYHVVAPDQRGYGRSDRPEAVEDYTILHTVGDVIGLIDALGEEDAVVGGHDWGGAVAWHAALMRPDRIRAVASLSAPHTLRPEGPPLAALRAAHGENHYPVYFQRPDTADAEFARDPRATMRRALYAASAEGFPWNPVVPAGGEALDMWPEPNELPDWLTEEDVDVYAEDFARTGFTGPLNWFRNFDRNWALTSPWHGVAVAPPALYITGDRDLGGTLPGAAELIAGRSAAVPNLRNAIVLPHCGHWTQQERPDDVNEALVAFLGSM
ncbi:alpha/beta hydrolase [Yinghuangia sp. ASG 101]|uniref:alpha/beta fold hydrolase n=1 Tax=Yinghuangia sp. ASG 101 TaxID=2896848 RepID=UPI001E60DBFB|nr:alpha/beta hydrolase [Yinghuangia sp. ASG 101]UGQ12112.1 alpha/beta hydrolase [Yinghuangia sp. ASG 101]